MPEYGEHQAQQTKRVMREQWEENVQRTVDEAYRAATAGKMALATGKTMRLYFLLERGLGERRSEYARRNIWLKLEDTDHEDRYHHNEVYRLLDSFEDVAEAFGFEMRWSSVKSPGSVISGFSKSDKYDLGAVVWNRLRADSRFPKRRVVENSLETLEAVAVEMDILPESVDETFVIGEDFEDSPLHEIYEKRRNQGRALQGIIVARDNNTGTGKTTLAVHLCKKWGEDWGSENATNRAGEYRDFLHGKPEGSVLLADEIGQMFDSRRSMSSENVAVSQDWQMIRTKQYITLSTLPGPSFLDKRLKKLGDVLMLCTRRGHARVYRLKVGDGSGNIWREHLCNVEWGALDDDEDYQEIEEMKRSRLKERFEGADQEDEGDEEIGVNTARREGRNETIRQLVENGHTQTDIAEALEMNQSTISKIAKGDSD